MTDSLARRHWPLVAALSVYWMTVVALVWQSMRLNQGHLIYPLDDAYVHMAIAKNASLHGVWGVTRYEFTSSAASPLWAALLAAVYWVGGVKDAPPLILNVVFGSFILVVAYDLIRRHGGEARWTCLVLLAVVFFSALPTLTVLGMEHTLHALVMLLFMSASATVISSPRSRPLARAFWLTALSAVLVAARYEGLFALAVVVALLIATEKRASAAVVCAGGLLPPAIYGLWATLHGWYPVPSAVLLKGYLPPPTARGFAQLLLWWHGLNSLADNPHVLVLVAASLLTLILLLPRSSSDERMFLHVIFIAVALLHLEFAQTGSFYRYEAYLLVVGLTVLGATAGGWVAALGRSGNGGMKAGVYAAAALLALVLVTPLAFRGWYALSQTGQATHNIFEQQYQMGLFLDRYYSGRSVAATDIGAITYLADIKLVDLYGLGSIEVARSLRAGTYSQAQIRSLTMERGVDVALTYDDWFDQYGGLPAAWTKVGEWVVYNNVVFGTNAVSFYAARPAEAPVLARDLKAFASNLPRDVTQRGKLTN